MTICKNIFFSLAYFVVIQYIIHNTHKCVNQLLTLVVRLPVNSRLLVIGDQKLYMGFLLHGTRVPLTPTLFKSQVYFLHMRDFDKYYFVKNNILTKIQMKTYPVTAVSVSLCILNLLHLQRNTFVNKFKTFELQT